MGDHVQIPLQIINQTNTSFDAVTVTLNRGNGWELNAPQPFGIGEDERIRQMLDLKINSMIGKIPLSLQATAGSYSDLVTRSITVAPRGFPVNKSHSALLSSPNPLSYSFTLPERIIPGSLKTRITIQPTPLSSMTEALSGLIREPHGCFEQTSSTNYPLIMVLQYFMSHQGGDPKLITRCKELLKKGYQRLTSFECKDNGYEWFGKNPGHEALSAYGVLEFSDMAKVFPVDKDMLTRTRQWLMKKRDGKGGFSRETHALHTWILDADCSNAYITWSLLRAGASPRELSKEIKHVLHSAQKSSNSYVKALAAGVAVLSGKKEHAQELMSALASLQKTEGLVQGGTTSIVGSRGRSLEVETTALSCLAWLQDPQF